MTGLIDTLNLGNAVFREAARLRHPEMDVDHVFLGLIAADPVVGQACARHGLSLHGARQALDDLSTGDLAALGITTPASRTTRDFLRRNASDAGSIPITARARDLICRLDGTAADRLQACLEEPSGTNRRLVEHVELSPAVLIATARELAAAQPSPGLGGAAGFVVTTVTGFICAPIAAVKDGISNPDLMAQVWQGVADQQGSADQRGVVNPQGRRAVPRCVRSTGGAATVVWTWASARPGWSICHTFELVDARGGTGVTLALTVRNPSRIGRMMAVVVRPWHRAALHGQLQHVADLITG